MSKPNTSETFFDANARFDGVIHLPSAMISESLPETIEDFLDCLVDMPEDHEIFKISAFKSYRKNEDAEELRELICMPGSQIKGFVFRMETPVYVRKPNCSAIRLSWSYRSFEWGYAPSWEEAEEYLLKWAERMHEADLKKSEEAGNV